MFWKRILVLFLIIFTYRLVRNLFRLLRTKFYLEIVLGKQINVPEEYSSSVSRLVSEAGIFILGSDREALLQAKGIFKANVIENFSPFFWIEGFLFFPQKALMYFGVKPKRKVGIFFEKLLTAVWWIVTFTIGLFSDEIKTYIISLFEQIQLFS